MEPITVLQNHPELVQEEALELKETHISNVLVGQKRVFKFKKPVTLDFIDQSPLSSRIRLCLQEYLLNSRLSPDVYLDVWIICEERHRNSAHQERLEDKHSDESTSVLNHISPDGSKRNPSNPNTTESSAKESGESSASNRSPYDGKEPETSEIDAAQPVHALGSSQAESGLTLISWDTICSEKGFRLQDLSNRTSPETSTASDSVQLRSIEEGLEEPVDMALKKCQQDFGTVLDACVVMKHLPDKTRLEEKVTGLQVPDMRNLAARIASFHRSLPYQPPSAGFASRLNNVLNTLKSLQEFPFEEEVQEAVSHEEPALKKRRYREVEGHGDLRPDHIYLQGESVSIIDCVEFSSEIRQVDPFEDIAFTTMGLRLEGREDLARSLALEYLHLYPDARGYLLLNLYEVYRASVRLMVDSLQLSNLSETPQNAGRRKRLLDRSREYSSLIQNLLSGKEMNVPGSPWPEPLIIVLMGLPATGKSLIARLLREDGIPVLSSDILRKGREQSLEKRRPTGFGQGKYSQHRKRRTYQHLLAMGRKLMGGEQIICLDASFSRKDYRQLLLKQSQASGFNGSVLFLETQCSEEVIQRRLKRRKEKGGASDLTEFRTWKEIQNRFESLELEANDGPDSAYPSLRIYHAILDTSGDKRSGSLLPEIRLLAPELFAGH